VTGCDDYGILFCTTKQQVRGRIDLATHERGFGKLGILLENRSRKKTVGKENISDRFFSDCGQLKSVVVKCNDLRFWK
jgi:hypothetical protein